MSDEQNRLRRRLAVRQKGITTRIYRPLAVLVALICAAGVGCDTSLAQECRTYVIRPPINNHRILERVALPAVCRDKTVMKITATRGEYDLASFLVATDQPLKQVITPQRRPTTFHLYLVATDTASRFRPFARRRRMIARPPAVRIRARKPWPRFLRIRLG